MKNSQTEHFSSFNASNYKIGIVVAQFNKDITEKILQSSLEKLKEYQISEQNITTWSVAGSVEIPAILKAAANSKNFNALIAIGAIIKGETDHYEYVAKIVTEGITQVMTAHQIPIGFAVLTTHNKELAETRTNIGAEAAEAIINSANIIKNI